MPDFVTSDLHSIASSWAIATARQTPEKLWREGLLIWEASKNYIYARTTSDNRVIIGGEDDSNIIEQDERDRLMPEKAKLLSKKLSMLWPSVAPEPSFGWSGVFGKTKDGLPLIGSVPKHARILAAYGYGGNGITFSFLASRMIGSLIAGEKKSWFDDFALDRAS
jgi:glycine/D-amino acid oxidase-like deaminating enzyme